MVRSEQTTSINGPKFPTTLRAEEESNIAAHGRGKLNNHLKKLHIFPSNFLSYGLNGVKKFQKISSRRSVRGANRIY
jgi:hypothetical protein